MMGAHRRLDTLLAQYYTGALPRREFVRRALRLGVAAAALPRLVVEFTASPARAQMTGSGEVVVCTWGGSYAAAQKKAFFDPFERDTGIRVRVTGTPDVAKIRAMVSTHNVEWDLVDAEGEMVIALGQDGMLERPDYSMIDRKDFIKGTTSEWGIGSVAYGYALGWSTRVYPKGREPRTWADFFDVQRFPGRRAMYNEPIPALEFALLADGVPMQKLYPIDVSRAFAYLRAHKAAVNIWYKQTAQIPTLMRGQEVDLIEGTSGRLSELKQGGAPVDFTWNQGAWLQSYWVVPKGAKNRENAMKLMAYYARPQNEAEFAELFASGVPNARAYGLMPKASADLLPTAPQNVVHEFQVDAAWWAHNLDAVTKQWLAFVGS
jgi:putative spermidine/putrescine transport system substrate-binding protein